MRKVSSRQFQQHYHTELKQLPFELTKHGETIAWVLGTKPEDVVTSTSDGEKGSRLCESGELDTRPGDHQCLNPSFAEWSIPASWQQIGKATVFLCKNHFEYLSSL